MATFGTFTTGQILTAAELNAAGTWVSFTPTWTNLTAGNGISEFKYSIFNKILWVRGTFTLGTTSAVGTTPSITIPLTKTTVGASQGIAELVDSGTVYTGTVVAAGTQIYVFSEYSGGTWSARGTVTAGGPFTWGNGDQISMFVTMEIA